MILCSGIDWFSAQGLIGFLAQGLEGFMLSWSGTDLALISGPMWVSFTGLFWSFGSNFKATSGFLSLLCFQDQSVFLWLCFQAQSIIIWFWFQGKIVLFKTGSLSIVRVCSFQ